MKPTIVNKDSNFVIITYWWGKGNKNKNTQRPCPDEVDENTKLSKQPMLYDKMIKNWESHCKKAKCNYMAVEYPEFAKKGMYQKAINMKPKFILQAIKACKPRSVVYIDGDMIVKKYPNIFDMKNVDFMARGYHADLDVFDPDYPCYFPYVFETSGGIMYFNDTPQSIKLLKMWQEGNNKYMGKADDRILSQVFNNNKFLLSSSNIQIPHDYLWLTMITEGVLKRKPFITHPECLTSEEQAGEDGADKDRYPPRYEKDVSDHINCGIKSVTYEYIAYDSKKVADDNKFYSKDINKMKTVTVVPYLKKYGQYNKNYKMNLDMMNNLRLSKYDSKVQFVSNHHHNLKGLHKCKKSELIPTILKLLEKGIHVIYVPKTYKKQSIDAVKKGIREKMDFICHNKNKDDTRYKKEFMLNINDTHPIYFSASNKTLQHLLRMSTSFSMVGSHFNRGIDFVSRIRCKWL